MSTQYVAYKLTLRDDALADRLRAGDQVELTVGIEPRPGDGVLVRDSDGNMFVRLYIARRGTEWSAGSLNPAYETLAAEKYGLQVLAVVTGVYKPGRLT